MRIVDRYLSLQWLKPITGALMIFLVLFLLIDFFGLVEQLLEHRPSPALVLKYLVYRTGYAIFFLSPMALLVGGFWMAFGLRKNNEWTVCQLTGSIPVEILRAPLAGMIVITLVLILVNCYFMPGISQQVELLDDYTLKNKTRETPVYHNIHSNLPDGRTIRMSKFVPDKKLIRGITISKKSGTKITFRLDSPEGHYEPGTGWVLQDVRSRKIKQSGEVITSRIGDKVIPLAPPSVLSTVLKMDPRRNDANPVQYTMEDLNTSIQYREKRNMNATTERILLHWKFGFPMTNFIMGLVGIIVGLRTRFNRAGGVGLCLLLGLGYWILFSLSISWGKVTGPLLEELRILPLVFVYGPALIGLGVAYYFWFHYSEQA